MHPNYYKLFAFYKEIVMQMLEFASEYLLSTGAVVSTFLFKKILVYFRLIDISSYRPSESFDSEGALTWQHSHKGSMLWEDHETYRKQEVLGSSLVKLYRGDTANFIVDMELITPFDNWKNNHLKLKCISMLLYIYHLYSRFKSSLFNFCYEILFDSNYLMPNRLGTIFNTFKFFYCYSWIKFNCVYSNC